MFRRETAKRRLRSSIQAHHNSRVLDSAAPVQQTRAYRPHVRSLDVLGHNREPVRIDHLDTVVEEKEPWTSGLLHRVIFRSRIIGHA